MPRPKTRKRRNDKGGVRTNTAWIMVNGKKGEVFFSDKHDKHLTAISTHYKRKIKTERLVAITTGKSKVKTFQIVKITLC